MTMHAEVRYLLNTKIPMRDEVELAADLYLPRSEVPQPANAAHALTPGAVYEYGIEVGVTGNVFRKRHRIRLEVSSSNFPRFDRNPNTGHPIGMDAELRAAQQTVHHGQRYPSHLVLPVIVGGM